jgi:hypothetical protein
MQDGEGNTMVSAQFAIKNTTFEAQLVTNNLVLMQQDLPLLNKERETDVKQIGNDNTAETQQRYDTMATSTIK